MTPLETALRNGLAAGDESFTLSAAEVRRLLAEIDMRVAQALDEEHQRSTQALRAKVGSRILGLAWSPSDMGASYWNAALHRAIDELMDQRKGTSARGAKPEGA